MYYVKLKRESGIINIASDNIINLVTVEGITYIQLGNMDNIQGVLVS